MWLPIGPQQTVTLMPVTCSDMGLSVYVNSLCFAAPGLCLLQRQRLLAPILIFSRWPISETLLFIALYNRLLQCAGHQEWMPLLHTLHSIHDCNS
jgi:hypothetical protein